ncbi:mercuric reductase [Phycisphaerales bacterium AB-hyl4]|uniref:Mercuric reductase n=1 Tax=Natronomicrosphaera hydrolytica TaxID=3242702 RepID=A0ABV4UA74_9BACT
MPLRPLDEHNRALRSHVQPTDWVNPTPPSGRRGRYNLVVIGAGTAGLVTAAGAAGMGAKVALIERGMLGGDCLNVGCVPSKALIRCARAVHDTRNAHRFGVKVDGEPTADFAAVMLRMRKLRAGIAPTDSAERFRDLGIDVYLGDAEFQDGNHVRVGEQTLTFARAVIATGARAAELPIEGLADVGYLTNETVFSLTELPKRLAVIGAGPIGCELAQAFARLGSRVTLVEAEKQILTREDADAAKLVEKQLRADGIEIICGGKAVQVRRDGKDKVLTLNCDGKEHDVRVDEILLGIGRQPNVDGLGLEAAGVKFDKRQGVEVNDYLQTTNKHIYAAGDVCSKFKFTHAADAMARIVIQNALFFGRAKASALTIPWCTYTDPEIAHVGLYEHEAKAQGIDVHTITIEMSDVDRAILDGETDGLLKVHLKRGSDRILGAMLVARHAGEMISELTLAMTAGLGLGAIAKTIHCYPTQAEVIKKAADAYNRTRLTPRVNGLLQTLLSWRR